MTPSSTTSGIDPSEYATTGVPRGHRLDHGQPERLGEGDRVQQRVRRRRAPRPAAPDRPSRGRRPGRRRRRLDLLAEVALVGDDPGDQQPPPGERGDLDRVGGALVGVDPAEDDEIVAAGRGERQGVEVDAVVDRGEVVELRHPVGVGDRDEGRRGGAGTPAGSRGRRTRGWWSPSAPGSGRRRRAAASRGGCAPGRTRPSVRARARRASPPRPARRGSASSAYGRGMTPSRAAEVTESRVANRVTSTPRATSPSASRPVTCSHGP